MRQVFKIQKKMMNGPDRLISQNSQAKAGAHGRQKSLT